MRVQIALIVLAGSWTDSAVADDLYNFVRFQCDKANDRVIVDYEAAYNEEGRKLESRMAEDDFNPWDLVEVVDGRVVSTRTVSRECTLSDGNYRVEIGPTPWNNNLYGQCGAMMSAWAAIFRDDQQLLRSGFEMGCSLFGAPIRNSISWTAGSQSPSTSLISHFDFYQHGLYRPAREIQSDWRESFLLGEQPDSYNSRIVVRLIALDGFPCTRLESWRPAESGALIVTRENQESYILTKSNGSKFIDVDPVD